MLPFGVNIPATVPQGSGIPEGLMNNPVLLVSETHFTTKTHFQIPQYNTYYTNHPDGTAHAGTAIIVKHTLRHHELSQYTSSKPHPSVLAHTEPCYTKLYNLPKDSKAVLTWRQLHKTLFTYYRRRQSKLLPQKKIKKRCRKHPPGN
jgi:hypothetical protein